MKVVEEASSNCLVPCLLFSAQEPHFVAISMLLSRRFSEFTNSSTAPYSSACSPVQTSLSKKKRRARWYPTKRGRSQVEPPSGEIPNEKKAAASLASGIHRR